MVKEVKHHPPLVLTLNDRRPNDPKTIVPTFYDFRNADHRSIAEYLSAVDWLHILDERDSNDAALTLSHIVGHVIDRHVPKVAHSTNNKPWLTRELRKLRTKKKSVLRAYSKYHTLSLHEHYKRLNTVYKHASRASLAVISIAFSGI